jgi:hypothetical protein
MVQGSVDFIKVHFVFCTSRCIRAWLPSCLNVSDAAFIYGKFLDRPDKQNLLGIGIAHKSKLAIRNKAGSNEGS